MIVRTILFAAVVAVIGAGALIMCDDSDAATGDIIGSGNCGYNGGSNLTYTLKSLNGDETEMELIIEGTGKMEEWKNTSGTYTMPWYEYHNNIIRLVLPEGLTTIGAFSFTFCKNLTSVDLPQSITTIGRSAFYASGLTGNLIIPASVTSIAGFAFNVQGITDITIFGTPSASTDAFSSNANTLTVNAGAEIHPTAAPGITNLILIGTKDWTSTTKTYSTQYNYKEQLETITFASDHIPTFALYGQDLERLTITNASNDDVLGIFTAPGVRATTQALTVDGTAADIVRLTDISGNAALTDGKITTAGASVSWTITPETYGGETTASPDVLVYPAKIHIGNDNGMGVLMTAISILLVVGLLMSLVLPMIARRLE